MSVLGLMQAGIRPRHSSRWQTLAGLDQTALAQIGSIGASRADLMLPGCALFASICNVWPSPMLRVADRGLREGMLRYLTQEN